MNPRIADVLKRDFPDSEKMPVCVYCGNHFDGKDIELEHLDNDRGNNALWNFAVVHRRCNQKKKHNVEYQHKARVKIVWNKARFYDDSKKFKSENEHIYSNMVLVETVTRFLAERLDTSSKKIEYGDTVDAIAYLQIKQIGHSSQPSVQRVLKSFTSSIADYKVIDTEDGKYIVRRTSPVFKGI